MPALSRKRIERGATIAILVLYLLHYACRSNSFAYDLCCIDTTYVLPALAVFGLLLIWFRDWITDRFGPTTATLGTVPTGYASFVAVIGWTLFLAPGLWWLIIGGMLAAS
jgi:hypothetical protein